MKKNRTHPALFKLPRKQKKKKKIRKKKKKKEMRKKAQTHPGPPKSPWNKMNQYNMKMRH